MTYKERIDSFNFPNRVKEIVILLCEGETISNASRLMGIALQTGYEYTNIARYKTKSKNMIELIAKMHGTYQKHITEYRL